MTKQKYNPQKRSSVDKSAEDVRPDETQQERSRLDGCPSKRTRETTNEEQEQLTVENDITTPSVDVNSPQKNASSVKGISINSDHAGIRQGLVGKTAPSSVDIILEKWMTKWLQQRLTGRAIVELKQVIRENYNLKELK